MNHMVGYTIIFIAGGFLYSMIEIAYRGYSHFAMFLTGGACFLMVGLVKYVLGGDSSLVGQMFVCGIMITAVELLVGLLVNRRLHMNIWDYSREQYNFRGQICLRYANLWFLLSAPMILLFDLLRYILLGISFQNYKLF